MGSARADDADRRRGGGGARPDAVASFRVRRAWLAGCAAAVVVLGLCVHVLLPDTLVTDAAGDALYAVLVYLLVACLVPAWPGLAVAGVAAAWCALVELFQLTGLPQAWGAVFPPVMLVLGTVFAPEDLAAYAVGIAAAAGADGAMRAAAWRRG